MKYYQLRMMRGMFHLPWDVDFMAPEVPVAGGLQGELYHLPAEEIEALMRLDDAAHALYRADDSRLMSTCCSLLSAAGALRMVHIQRGQIVATSKTALHVGVMRGKPREQGFRRPYTSRVPFETMWCSAEDSALHVLFKVWSELKAKNQSLQTLLVNHRSGEPISQGQWQADTQSVMLEYGIRAGRQAGVLQFRSMIATAMNVRGPLSSLPEAYAAGDWSCPRALRGSQAPTGNACMPIRYSANKHETTEYARVLNARLFNLARRSRTWQEEEAVTWEALRPLLTRELLDQATLAVN